MRDLIIGIVALAGAACAAPAETPATHTSTATPTATSTATSLPFTLLNPRDYQAFVPNWTPADHPICAVLTSGTEWNRAIHPAATMGSHSYAPPGTLWNDHAVLMIARGMNQGDMSHVFEVHSVTRGADGTDVDYTYTPQPPGTYTVKWYLAVVVDKPVSGAVRFHENGQVVCEATAPAG